MSGRIDGKIGRYEIKFANGDYLVSYAIAMEKPKPAGGVAFEDEALQIAFDFDSTGIAFTLADKTDNPLKVDWNQASFVDTEGGAHRVMHQGVRFIQCDEPTSPITVPLGAKLRDFVYPTDLVLNLRSDWLTPPLLPVGMKAMLLKGKMVSVFLPLEINGAAKNYNFVFAIKNVQPK